MISIVESMFDMFLIKLITSLINFQVHNYCITRQREVTCTCCIVIVFLGKVCIYARHFVLCTIFMTCKSNYSTIFSIIWSNTTDKWRLRVIAFVDFMKKWNDPPWICSWELMRKKLKICLLGRSSPFLFSWSIFTCICFCQVLNAWLHSVSLRSVTEFWKSRQVLKRYWFWYSPKNVFQSWFVEHVIFSRKIWEGNFPDQILLAYHFLKRKRWYLVEIWRFSLACCYQGVALSTFLDKRVSTNWLTISCGKYQ